MINLIPNEEKKTKVKDFYFRLLVVFLFVLGFSMTIACTMILPAYFLSVVKKNVINTRLEIQKNEPVPELDQEILGAVADLEYKLELLEKNQQDKYPVSQSVINKILLKKMTDIKITGIIYDNRSPQDAIIHINGIAPSRERLLLFRRAFEDDASFKRVDLPISNFIQGSNIEFSLSLIPS
ncbi:MAG: hypothetical protein WD963_01875 [Candidatus Paceibacterota bacterium]